jgi:hypothetical protein
MSEMNQTKALQHALITVGTGAVIVYIALVLMGARAHMWPELGTIIILSSLALIPFIYRRYLNGPKELTRRQHLMSALFYAGILTVELVDGSSKAGFLHSVSSQFFTLAWMTGVMLDHLRQAFKADNPELKPYEY